MSDIYHSNANASVASGSGGSSANSRNNNIAPTRARKRIFDHETNPEEVPVSSSSRRISLYTGYHETLKGQSR